MTDEISDLRLFAAIVAAGNLSAAARALNSSPAAMSRRLTALESRLGVHLVVRTSRQFTLTEEGELLHDRCQQILADIDEAEAAVSLGGIVPKGKLRIGAPMDIGRKQIAPLISRFSDRYPAIQVHLALSDAGGDLIDDGIDIALRVILPADTSILVRKVLSTKRVACASPEYIKKYGSPATPEDLLKHNCICLVRGRRVFDSWTFHNGPKRVEVRVKGNLTTTSGEVMHDWALAGKGIAFKALWDVPEDLASGRLVSILTEHWSNEIELFAIYANREIPVRMRVFLDFLVAELKSLQSRLQTIEKKLSRRIVS
jgi:DNA-binding transcriptional LysR family regulator